MALQVVGNLSPEQEKIMRTLENLEKTIQVVMTCLPDCYEKEQSRTRFYEGLMWAGSSANRCQPVVASEEATAVVEG